MTETVVTVQHPSQGPRPQTTTTTTSDGLGWIQFNLQYFTTIPGILKLAQLVSQQPGKHLVTICSLFCRQIFFLQFIIFIIQKLQNKQRSSSFSDLYETKQKKISIVFISEPLLFEF